MRFDTETPASKIVNRVMPWTKGRRPAWMIRFGLFLYDNLGGRKILPGTWSVDLTTSPPRRAAEEEVPPRLRIFRLLGAGCAPRGAQRPRRRGARGDRADPHEGHRGGPRGRDLARDDRRRRDRRDPDPPRKGVLVNAGGPWVEEIVRGVVRLNTTEGIRLVRGSHIVTKEALRPRQMLLLPRRRRPDHLRHSLRGRLHADRHDRRRARGRPAERRGDR